MASPGDARRVVIVVQNLPVPFDRRVWLEATTLAEAGYRVTVICPQGKGFDRSSEVLEGVRVLRYRLPFDAAGPAGYVAEMAWCFARTAIKLARVTVTGGYDVLHVCNPPETFWPLAHVGRLFGRRFLFDHHDLSPEMYAAKFDRPNRLVSRALEFLERRTFRAADVVIAVNESHRRVALERGGVDPGRLHVVRSGPDLARLRPTPPDPAVRGGHRHVLVYLGEICRQDGVDHLIRALRILRDELGRHDVHCLVVGGGPHQPEIKAYAQETGVADLCTFAGRVSDEDLCRLLSSADLGVDPDPKNPWSDRSTMNKVIEYMHFGLPVVGYRLGENAFSAGAAGRFAEPNDERALARCIAELLDDPAARQAMARAGRERVRDALSWEHSRAPLLAAYDELFGAHRRPLPQRGAQSTAAAQPLAPTRSQQARGPLGGGLP